jgi:HTH-type transcriptional regulator, sugar sensing transcriptional regulator
MSVKEECVEILMNLGLTSSQARIYLSLVKAGTSTVKEIASSSQVAREQVYLVLPTLLDLGVVEKILERPIKYRPVPLPDCFSSLILERKNQTNELENAMKTVIDKFNESNSVGKSSRSHQFVFVPSKRALFRRINKAVNDAESSISVFTSCRRLTQACDKFFDSLQDAWDRGVKGRAIINVPKHNQLSFVEECWRSPWAELRFIPEIPNAVFAIYDNKEAFTFPEPETNLSESPALWSNYPSFVRILKDHYKILWITALEQPQYHLDSSH